MAMAKNRLTSIVTKAGDKGLTTLADGQSVSKESLFIETLGALDEFNASVGVLRAQLQEESMQKAVIAIQQKIFDLGAECSLPKHSAITADDVSLLECQIKRWNKKLPPLKEFILPGKDAVSAQCHVCRTLCRRAERRWLALAKDQSLNPISLRYLNRLSDYLFVMARLLTKDSATNEIMWGQR